MMANATGKTAGIDMKKSEVSANTVCVEWRHAPFSTPINQRFKLAKVKQINRRLMMRMRKASRP